MMLALQQNQHFVEEIAVDEEMAHLISVVSHAEVDESQHERLLLRRVVVIWKTITSESTVIGRTDGFSVQKKVNNSKFLSFPPAAFFCFINLNL